MNTLRSFTRGMRLAAVMLATGYSLLATAAAAADPVISVPDENTTLVDGSNWGLPGDVIVNNPKLAPAVNLALKAFHAARRAETDAKIKTAEETAAKAVSEAKAESAQAIADSAAAVKSAQDAQAAAEARATAAEQKLAAVTAALKSVALGVPLPPVVAAALVSEDAKRKAALEKQQADIAAELAKLP